MRIENGGEPHEEEKNMNEETMKENNLIEKTYYLHRIRKMPWLLYAPNFEQERILQSNKGQQKNKSLTNTYGMPLDQKWGRDDKVSQIYQE